MTNKRQIFFLLILIFISLQVLYAQKIENPDHGEYDIVISIKDTAERFLLKPIQKEQSGNYSNPLFKSYHLKYAKSVANSTKNLKVLENNFITQPNDTTKDNNATINLGFWNLPRRISDNNRIVLSNEIKYAGSSTSVLFLIKDYAAKNLSDTNTYLFTIPFKNNKEIDAIFPDINHHCRVLFILWERQPSNTEYFPKEIEGLKISITNLHSGNTDYYTKYIRSANTIQSEANKRNTSNIEEITVTDPSKSVKKVTNITSVETKSIKYRLSFKKVGPKKLNWDNFPDPKSLELSIPISSFNNEGVYFYNPKTDTINPHPEFALMWTIPINEKIVLDKINLYPPPYNVSRAARIKNFQFVIKGNLPKKEQIEYYYNSTLYYPKDNNKSKKIKGTDAIEQKANISLAVSDYILPDEKITFTFLKPYNYNLSLSGGEPHEWKESKIDAIVEHTNDTIIKLDLDRIPPFQFFYIDLSGFENLQKIKDLLKAKIGEQNNDCFIFVSNSGRPLIWQTSDDLDELLTRISLMRPEPASYYDEARFIKPYIDEMVDDESIYSVDRREVHFNFLFSQSFLNYSSLDFIQDCMGDLINEKLFDKGRVNINLFSTMENTSYKEIKDNDKIREKAYYSNIRDIKKYAVYIKLK